jgi:hypothetical protein
MAPFSPDFAHAEKVALAGKLLTTFWQPIALSRRLCSGNGLAHRMSRPVMAAGRQLLTLASSLWRQHGCRISASAPWSVSSGEGILRASATAVHCDFSERQIPISDQTA